MERLATMLEVKRDLSPQLRQDLARQPLALRSGRAEVVIETLTNPPSPALEDNDSYAGNARFPVRIRELEHAEYQPAKPSVGAGMGLEKFLDIAIYAPLQRSRYYPVAPSGGRRWCRGSRGRGQAPYAPSKRWRPNYAAVSFASSWPAATASLPRHRPSIAEVLNRKTSSTFTRHRHKALAADHQTGWTSLPLLIMNGLVRELG